MSSRRLNCYGRLNLAYEEPDAPFSGTDMPPIAQSFSPPPRSLPPAAVPECARVPERYGVDTRPSSPLSPVISVRWSGTRPLDRVISSPTSTEGCKSTRRKGAVHPVAQLANVLSHHLVSDKDHDRDRRQNQGVFRHRLAAYKTPAGFARA